MAKVRVRVPLVIEIDTEQWYEEFGRGRSTKEVVDEVRDYVLNNTQGAPAIENTGAKVSLGR